MAKLGDVVLIDFTGRIDGKVFEVEQHRTICWN